VNTSVHTSLYVQHDARECSRWSYLLSLRLECFSSEMVNEWVLWLSEVRRC